MSHKFYKPARSRLHRSELAVPGSSPKMFEKVLSSAADYVFLDLEDAVSPNDKISARANVLKALNEMDWRGSGKTISVRINSCLLYTSPSPRDKRQSRMPSSA